MKNYLIILPGWGERPTDNLEVAETAPDNWEVVKVSYSDLMPHVKVQEFIRNLNLFLTKKGIRKFYLLGCSMGGVLAMEYAILHPGKLHRLYLLNSEGIKAPSNFIKLSVNCIRSNPYLFTKKFGQVLKTIPGILVKPRWNMKLIRLAEESSMEDLAKKIKISTTILWGDADKITPFWQGKKLHSLIPNSKLVVLSGLKHDWLSSHANYFWQSI